MRAFAAAHACATLAAVSLIIPVLAGMCAALDASVLVHVVLAEVGSLARVFAIPALVAVAAVLADAGATAWFAPVLPDAVLALEVFSRHCWVAWITQL